jgi:hypothetical protein
LTQLLSLASAGVDIVALEAKYGKEGAQAMLMMPKPRYTGPPRWHPPTRREDVDSVLALPEYPEAVHLAASKSQESVASAESRSKSKSKSEKS